MKNLLENWFTLFQILHAAVLHFPSAYFSIVRPGLMTYGYQPSPELPPLEGLKPIMSVKSRVTRVRRFPKNHTIGYGMAQGLEQETKIAFISFGYEDGFDRAFSNKGHVLIKGKKVPIIGNISMNSFAVNVSSIDEVEPGDEVVIIGQQGDEEIKLQNWAIFLGTIVNELLMRFNPQLPRIYISDDENYKFNTQTQTQQKAYSAC